LYGKPHFFLNNASIIGVMSAEENSEKDSQTSVSKIWISHNPWVFPNFKPV